MLDFVSTETTLGDITLTFPTNKGFGCFEPGDVVQGYNVASGYSTGRPNTILLLEPGNHIGMVRSLTQFMQKQVQVFIPGLLTMRCLVFVIKRLSGQDAPSARWFITDDSGTRPYGLADFDPVDQTLTVSEYDCCWH